MPTFPKWDSRSVDRCVVPLDADAPVPRSSAAVRREATGIDKRNANRTQLFWSPLRRASPARSCYLYLINRAIRHSIDGFYKIGILVGVFVAEQQQIVQGIAPQDIAEA